MRVRHAITAAGITVALGGCGSVASPNELAELPEIQPRSTPPVIDRPAEVSAPAKRIVLRRVAVFTATAGFRHGSIVDGVDMIRSLGDAHDFEVMHTESTTELTSLLDDVEVVVFLNTTGDVLDSGAEEALERYVRAGGGWVGIHSAADTEYDWPFYGELLGDDAWFRSHPPGTSEASLDVAPEHDEHLAVRHLPDRFEWNDEWYAFRTLPGATVDVLLRLDETTYAAGDSSMGDDHPIAWSHDVDAGRSWYTGVGHRPAMFDDPDFRQHVLGGLRWAAGFN